MNGEILNDCVRVAHAAILEHRDEIAGLDQAIGDGDHVFNIIRGLEALEAMRDDLAQKPIADALKASARKLLETIGGSSGPLFATLLLGMSKACESDAPNPSELAKMFNEGVRSRQGHGRREDDARRVDSCGECVHATHPRWRFWNNLARGVEARGATRHGVHSRNDCHEGPRIVFG
jgi:dihydroxyacetone kinase